MKMNAFINAFSTKFKQQLWTYIDTKWVKNELNVNEALFKCSDEDLELKLFIVYQTLFGNMLDDH